MSRQSLHGIWRVILPSVLVVLAAALWVRGFKHVNASGGDISGTVTSAKGPEAGVWVIAETKQLPTGYRKIVVTDDQGRYVLPDLPDATYDLFVRGYGLVDSPRVKGTPGATVNLTAVIAPTPQAAAQIYPPNYWLSLLELPPKSDFPGTGASGNGINPRIKTQEEWAARVSDCSGCHQLGDKATREIEPGLGAFDTSVEAWARRTQSGQEGSAMIMALGGFGTRRYLELLASWTDRIKAGELPPVPPRPRGLERNVVITVWDWADQHAFVHDLAVTDERKPTVNANGLVWGVSRLNSPDLISLDPVTNTAYGMKAPVRDADTPFTAPQSMIQPSPYWGKELIWQGQASLHNATLDSQGRVWLTHQVRSKPAAFCQDGSILSSKLFPLQESEKDMAASGPRNLSFYDPKTKKWELIDTCFTTHHLLFAEDANNTLWTSGAIKEIGWLNTKLFEQTHDAAKSQGWTAFVLDTNGNGKRDEYVGPNDPVDPKKDKRIEPGTYGLAINPVDGSVWTANARSIGGAIVRVAPGPDPAATALTEIYEPPAPGAGPRGVDVDRNGLVWTALAASGHIASFDRSKCKVLNGPTATGKHCPEGWKLYPVPGPSFKNGPKDMVVDMLYYCWVDQFNTLGMGENVVIATGTNSESLLVLDPKTSQIYRFHLPYPMGFYHRGVDGRIDNPATGWKGRGLWANYGSYTPWHYEGGKGTTSKAVHFQLRPDPLSK